MMCWSAAEDADDGSNEAYNIRGRNAGLLLPGRAAAVRRVSPLFYLLKQFLFVSGSVQRTVCPVASGSITCLMGASGLLIWL